MSQTNSINTRIQHKHDTEANWLKATTFVPKAGELIIYDVDDNNATPRFKVGDGSTVVTNLPFSNEGSISGGDDKVSKAGDTMTGNLTINPGALILTNDSSNGTAQIYKNNSATVDNGTAIRDLTADGTQTTLVVSGKSGTDNLLRINHALNGESTIYKVLHAGTQEAKKLEYTNIAYGTCSTAAATAAKEVTIEGNSNWSLQVGSIIVIKFTNANSVASPKLNVNNTGAKGIWYNTAELTTSNYGYAIPANCPVMFMYDGTYYVWMGYARDLNASYTNQSLGNGYGICDTAADTSEKAVTLSGYKLVTHGMVSVKFNYDVWTGASMNINSTGAKPIYHNMTAIKSNVIKAGDLATFILTGFYYMLIAVDRVPIDYTATITTTWNGTAAPYSQTIAVNAITAADKPVVDVVMSGTYATDVARLTDWSKIYRIVTAANQITVYATAKTSVSLPIQLRSVR